MEMLVPYKVLKEAVGHTAEVLEMELGEEAGFISPAVSSRSSIRRTFSQISAANTSIPCDELAALTEELTSSTADETITMETIGDITQHLLTKQSLNQIHLTMTKRGLLYGDRPSKGSIFLTLE